MFIGFRYGLHPENLSYVVNFIYISVYVKHHYISKSQIDMRRI